MIPTPRPAFSLRPKSGAGAGASSRPRPESSLSGRHMRHWLIKSEPSAWSWDQQVAAGKAGTPWNGVRNHAAKLNLMAMAKGDLAFFYHSNEGKAVVGVAEVVREHYPDPETPGEPWVLVD